MREEHIFSGGGYAYVVGDEQLNHYWCWCYFPNRDPISTSADSDRLDTWRNSVPDSKDHSHEEVEELSVWKQYV